MIRNLKVLIAAAMALAAFGALSATAHAAEEKFHCSVEPCRATLAPDEAAGTTTAHHVFVLKGHKNGQEASASFTCNQLTGEATTNTKTATELTFTNLAYKNSAGEVKCKIGASETMTINFTSCGYKFTSAGGSTSTAQIHLICTTAGDGIDISIAGVLCYKITPFTASGIGYHTVNLPRVVTATANVTVPAALVDVPGAGNPVCPEDVVTSAVYTTGNTLVKAESDPGGVAAEAWFE